MGSKFNQTYNQLQKGKSKSNRIKKRTLMEKKNGDMSEIEDEYVKLANDFTDVKEKIDNGLDDLENSFVDKLNTFYVKFDNDFTDVKEKTDNGFDDLENSFDDKLNTFRDGITKTFENLQNRIDELGDKLG